MALLASMRGAAEFVRQMMETKPSQLVKSAMGSHHYSSSNN
jgi:hypothetical protein